MSSNFQSILFHQDALITTVYNNKLYVAVKPVCKAIGINWEGQRQRIYRHKLLSQNVFITKAPSNGGLQKTLFLSLDMLTIWMSGIRIRRVKTDAHKKLRLYQQECCRTLQQYIAASSNGIVKSNNQHENESEQYRYRVRIFIYDNLFGGCVEINSNSNTFKDVATNIATNLGWQPEKLNACQLSEQLKRIY